MPTEATDMTTNHSANGAAYRFPGTRPFADSALERRLFFGRSAEASDLFHQLLSADLLVLYGKSGLGKTSLLQAGIFPRLRQRGFLPLLVRLNRPEAPLLQTIIFDIEKSCRDQQIDYSPGDTTGLWQFFKTAIFWRDGDLQTPVLVFDQFEELFTLYAPEQRQAFATQLGELVKLGLPSSIRAQREKGEPLSYSERPPAIKVILAFRESYLGELQALAYEIPKVMENRFRLLSMDRAAARQAIVEPALLAEEKALVSPTFNFSEDALEELLGFLAGQKGDIEPFALQLLCSHVERELVPTKAKTDRRDITITATELGGHQGMGAVMRTFYAARIAQLPGYWQRKRARRLCAYGLLTADGRRVSLEEGQILNEYDVSKQTLSRLASDSVLRKTPYRGGSYYELSHDKLIQPVLDARPIRIPRKWRSPLGAFASFLLCTFVALFLTGRHALQLQSEKELVQVERDHAQSAERVANEAKQHVERALTHVGEEKNRADRAAAHARQEQKRAEDAKAESEQLLSYMTEELSRRLREVGQVALTKDVNQRAIEVYLGRYRNAEDLDKANPRELAIMAFSLWNAADLATETDEALRNYDRGLLIWELLTDREPSKRLWWVYRSMCIASKASVLQSQGKLDDALKHYQHADKLLEILAQGAPDDVGIQSNHATIHSDIGSIYQTLGSLEKASQQFVEVRNTLQRILQRDPKDDAILHRLAWAHVMLGDVANDRGQADVADSEYKAARTMVVDLIGRHPTNLEFRRTLGALEERVGLIYLSQLQLTKARSAFAEMLKIFRQLSEPDPNDKDPIRSVLISEFRIGAVSLAGYEQANSLLGYHAAQVWITRRGTIAARLVENVAGPRALASTFTQAQEAYVDAIRLGNSLTEHDPRNVQWAEDLADSHASLGDALVALGRLEEGLQEYDIALGLVAKLRQRTPADSDVLLIFAKREANAGWVHLRRAEFGEARTAFTTALRMSQDGVIRYPNNRKWQGALATSQDGLGDVLLASSQLEDARTAYMAALKIREELVAFSPSNGDWQLAMAVSLYKLAILELEAGVEQQQIEVKLNRSLDILRQLDSQGRLPPVAEKWSDLIEGELTRVRAGTKEMSSATDDR